MKSKQGQGLVTNIVVGVGGLVITVIVIFLVIVLEFLGPLLIVYSTINEEYKVYGLYSLYALIVFTILATILYHKPMSGSFYSHLSIIGGLLALLVVFQK